MMKNKLFLLALLPFLALASCNQKASGNKDTIMVNDFENLDQLALLKFPFPRHADRGRIDLVSEHATHGDKALKYYNEYGTSIEMGHYFTNIAGGEIDISNMKSMEIDVFNASVFDTSCAVTFYATEDMDAILTESFSLKKDELTHISFELSKIALEYNYENIYCVTLRLLTPNTDYDRGIGYTFFVDNWHVKMGSEYTEEDLKYKPIIDSTVSLYSLRFGKTPLYIFGS